MNRRRLRLPRLSRGRARTTGLLVAAQVVNLAAILVVTRLYSPDAFGRYATLAAVTAVVGGVSSLRLDVAATTATDADAILLLRYAAAFNVAAGGALGLAVLGWHAGTGAVSGADGAEALAAGALTVALGLSVTLVYARARDRRYGLVAGAKLLGAVVGASAQVGLGLVGASSTMLLVAVAAGYAASALLLLRPGDWLGRRPGHRSGAAGYVGAESIPELAAASGVLRRHRGFIVASTPAGLVNAMTLNVPLFVAAASVGGTAAADLALALRIGVLPSALFGQALMPMLYGEIAHQLRTAPRRARATYDRALAGLAVVGTVLLGMLAFGVQAAATTVFGPEWGGAGSTLLLLTPFLIGQFAVAPLSQTLAGAGRNGQQLGWDLARLLAAVTVFLPVLAGWIGWPTGLASFSLVVLVAYAAHVLLSRAALNGLCTGSGESTLAGGRPMPDPARQLSGPRA